MIGQSRLLKSWAMPPASRPTASMRWAWTSSFSSSSRAIVDAMDSAKFRRAAIELWSWTRMRFTSSTRRIPRGVSRTTIGTATWLVFGPDSKPGTGLEPSPTIPPDVEATTASMNVAGIGDRPSSRPNRRPSCDANRATSLWNDDSISSSTVGIESRQSRDSRRRSAASPAATRIRSRRRRRVSSCSRSQVRPARSPRNPSPSTWRWSNAPTRGEASPRAPTISPSAFTGR